MVSVVILGSIYCAVALIAMRLTILEARENHRASLSGTIIGCIVCLFWLPALVGMLGLRTARRWQNAHRRASQTGAH